MFYAVSLLYCDFWVIFTTLVITSSHYYDYNCSCLLIIVMLLLLISVTHIYLCNNNVCKDSLSLCCRYLKVKLPLWMYPHYLSHYIFSERIENIDQTNRQKTFPQKITNHSDGWTSIKHTASEYWWSCLWKSLKVKVTCQLNPGVRQYKGNCYLLNIALKITLLSFSHFSNMFYDPEGICASLQGNLPL